jgi:tetratricopeptide (TPR) repeat protein
MAMAHQARERAMATDKHAVAVEHWQDAFEQYRNALTAGWGTDIDFADTEQLKERIEETVGDLIGAHRAYAETLEAAGDRALDSAGDTESARTRYRQARNQVDDALGLAREFRSGDPDAMRAFRDRLDEKLTQIGDDA